MLPAHVTRLDKIKLLDGQFGRHPRLNVPESLSDLLFAGGDGCFVLLDAARIENLPYILEGSGLDHDCLFQGAAATDLGTAAPWIVELRPDSDLTRRLLSATDAHWSLWGRDAAVFLRSPAALADLRRHFRRMTRLQDAQTGRWLYFRFYAAPTLRDLVAGMAPDRLRQFAGPVRRFVVPDGEDAVIVIDRPPDDPAGTGSVSRGQDAAV